MSVSLVFCELDRGVRFHTNEFSEFVLLFLRTLSLDAREIFRAVVREGGIVRAAALQHRVRANVTMLQRNTSQRPVRREKEEARQNAGFFFA